MISLIFFIELVGFNRHSYLDLNELVGASRFGGEVPLEGAQSTHSTPRSEARGMPSTRAQAEGLRVDTERCFLPRFKNRGLAPSNVSKRHFISRSHPPVFGWLHGRSGPLTVSRACQESLLTRRDAVRLSHRLNSVTKSCDLFVTTSPPLPPRQAR